MTNKAFVRLLVLLPLLMIAAAGVYLFTRSSPESPSVPAEVSLSSKPQALVPERVLSPVLSFDREKIWFMTEEGKLFRKHIEGSDPPEEYPLSAVIQNPEGVLWPTDSKDFIVVSTLDGHSRYLFFDATSSTLAPYPPTLRSPQFLPGGNKIVYDWVTQATHELKVSDARGTNFTKIADLFRPDYELLASPVKQEVALWTRDLKNPSKLLVVDLFTGKFRALGTNAGYQGVSFSPDGTKLLAAKLGDASGGPPRLVLFDLLTSQARDLSLTAEIERTAWQEDGQALLVGSPAGFIKYQVDNQEQEEIYKFGESEAYSPQNLILHPQKPLLFFVDQKTGYLYRLEL